MKSFFTYSCILAIIAISVEAYGTNYCSIKCVHPFTRQGIQHIGCNPPRDFDRRNCQRAQRVSLTPGLKKYMIDLHNEKRNIIAGGGDNRHRPACRMATMSWDNELEYLSSLNVLQCNMEHDYCHNTVAFKHSGQNLYESYQEPIGKFNSHEELKGAIEYWYREKQYSNQNIIDKFPQSYSGPAIGHFTAMVAEKNNRVGCSAATYSKGNRSFYLVACNYATTNMMNEPIYTSCARGAAKCSRPNPLYRNLCSESERYVLNK